MSRRALVAAAALAALAAMLASTASGSRYLKVGIYDDAQILGNPDWAFPQLKRLRTQVIRVNLAWPSVAVERPAKATDPADPAYHWDAYDDMVTRAKAARIRVLLTITATPRWAGGGRRGRKAPKRPIDLRNFAYAAAKRYSGSFTPEGADQALPAVRFWLAWNEPNNPVFLTPQFKKVGKRYVVQSARDYARICNAVVQGVRATLLKGEKIACGATGPRGNNKARSGRPSVSPIPFLRAMKKAGARGFDAYAHHPYYGRPRETPTARPKGKTAVTLGNIGDLIKEVTRLYGRKRIWLTEYGYQTKPPDRSYGVSWKLQARYLSQAFVRARKNPRIDMLVWFLLKDEPRKKGFDGWQSGFFTTGGKRKPAFTTFARLPH